MPAKVLTVWLDGAERSLIEEMMEELRLPGTSIPAVTRIIATRKDLSGEGQPHPADLIVQWHPTLKNEIYSPRLESLALSPTTAVEAIAITGSFVRRDRALRPGRSFPKVSLWISPPLF